MAKDLECPYCEKYLEVNHDDGMGYEEDVNHQMQCGYCKKNFVFTTSISYSYYPEKADCLNDSEHKWQKTHTFPKEATKMYCEICGEERQPTKEEFKRLIAT